jgi:hypothetical protein
MVAATAASASPKSPHDFRRGRLAGLERRREGVASGERGQELDRRAWASHRFLLKTSENGRVDRRVEPRNEARRTPWDIRALSGIGLGGFLGRSPPREHLVEHQPESVDVGARRDLPACELLRRHVSGGAPLCLSPTQSFRRGGEPEVRDAGPAPAVEHDVRGLQVAMNDPLNVRGREAGGDLPCEVEGLLLRKAADPT